MVADNIIEVVRTYLRAVQGAGINARRGVLFGSFARGEAEEWSDIDLVVIAPELDDLSDRSLVTRLWALRAETDSRIEPIPCGEREWEINGDRHVIEVARREGIVITA
jgi:predicted nucleotidyltransferase